MHPALCLLAAAISLQAGPAPAAPAVPAAPAAPAAPGARATAPVAHDRITVTLPEARASLLEGGLREGRMIVFMISANAQLDNDQPVNGPFFEAPQPIFSVPVAALVPGKPIEVSVDAAAFPVPLDQLSGEYRVQACFDRNIRERSHVVAGNLLSAEQTIAFAPDRADVVSIELSRSIPPEPEPQAPNLKFFSMKSTMLSQALGYDVHHRVGVALPRGWEDPGHRRRMWPSVYVVPGFGGRSDGAERYARMLATDGSQAVVPQAVWIVLDPESDWGHHGFADSVANGPRARALVEELIPELERQFRLISRAEARILTGHSSGAWSSLWLQLMHPATFGACFASAPDPVDFSAFQRVDLYADLSYFSDAEGHEQPSFRTPIGNQFDKVRMTNRDETGMEFALSPEGRSGEQLDSYAAMFSALDPATRLPLRAWDPRTGLIDRGVVEREWSRYDIARLVRAKPDHFVPILREKVRLLVGERDNFYLERAVAKLKAIVQQAEAKAAAAGHPYPAGRGYIEIMPDETHSSLPATAMLRWHNEMRDYLKAHSLD